MFPNSLHMIDFLVNFSTFIYSLIGSSLFSSIYLLTIRIFPTFFSNKILKLRLLVLFLSIGFSIWGFLLSFLFFLSIKTFPLTSSFTLELFSISFICSPLQISFLLLFNLLFPIIFIYILQDYAFSSYTLIFYFFNIQLFTYLLLFLNNMLFFYFVYELLLILIFNVMYLSSNNRGSIEATLFYAGWALLGSILIGFSFLYIFISTNIVDFSNLPNHHLITSEVFWIYMGLFLGFGTKLSLWPMWYWLPKAHVEVSTGMSIFLSCILIKVAYFGLLRIQMLLSTEISYNICILLALCGILDVVLRIVNLKDLKALIAYSSVLHTNLLLILIHIDIYKITLSSFFYVWGHSLATTGLFICINIIELQYSSRNIFQVTGLWQTNPLLAYILLWNLFFFIDLPFSLFFWGEFWLFLVFFENFFKLTLLILVFTNLFFLSIFFKFWWNVLSGVPNFSVASFNLVWRNGIFSFALFLIGFQLLTGFQAHVLNIFLLF